MAERCDLKAEAGWVRLLDARPDPASTPQSDLQSPTSSGPQFPHLKGMGLDPFALTAPVTTADVQWSPHDVFV